MERSETRARRERNSSGVLERESAAVNPRHDDYLAERIAIRREGNPSRYAGIAAMLRQLRKVVAQPSPVWADASRRIGEAHRCVVGECGIAIRGHAVALSKTLNERSGVVPLHVRSKGRTDVDTVGQGRIGAQHGPSVAANEVGVERLTSRFA